MTPLDKSLKRALTINGCDYVITITRDALKITQKGHRLGVELKWPDLVSGETALAVALNASVGKFQDDLQLVGHQPKGVARRHTKAKTAATIARRGTDKRSAPKRLR
jgi:hypothetical protein